MHLKWCYQNKFMLKCSNPYMLLSTLQISNNLNKSIKWYSKMLVSDWFLKNLFQIFKWVVIFKFMQIYLAVQVLWIYRRWITKLAVIFSPFLISMAHGMWLWISFHEEWHRFPIPWIYASFVIYSGQQNVSDTMFCCVLPLKVPWNLTIAM